MKTVLLSMITGFSLFAGAAWAAPGDVVFEAERRQAIFLQTNYRAVVVAENLDLPWGLEFLPNGDALVTEKPGRLRLLRDGVLLEKPIAGVPDVVHDGSAGLLDISLHPDFENNALVYLCYSARDDDEDTFGERVGRARLFEDRLVDFEVIFKAETLNYREGHNGCRMVWNDKGQLFATFGERWDMKQEAQNPANHYGSIVRLNDDGSLPSDNPFLGDENASDAIWSYGHRNPQGAALHPQTRELWIHEHGAAGGDELNIARPGRNYGWPLATYGVDYSGEVISAYADLPMAGMEDPIYYWRPSIAPSGMAFYTGDAFPNWKGNLFIGALAGMNLYMLDLSGGRIIHQDTLLDGLNVRIRDIVVGPDDLIYVLTDSTEGRLLRIEPLPQFELPSQEAATDE